MHNPSRPDIGLTERQQEVWRYLARHLREEQSGATFRDVCLAMGITSPNGAWCHVLALEQKGLLMPGRRDGQQRARSLRLAGVRLELTPLDSPAGEVARYLLQGVPPPAPITRVAPGRARQVLKTATALVTAIDRGEGEIPALLAELQDAVHDL
jgi:SOS-response transcriptional repressor LexA